MNLILKKLETCTLLKHFDKGSQAKDAIEEDFRCKK